MSTPTGQSMAELATALEHAAKLLRAMATSMGDIKAPPRAPFCKGGVINAEHLAHCPAFHTTGDAL